MLEDGLAAVKDLCRKQSDCHMCGFYDREDHTCSMIDEPMNWDIDKIVAILRKSNNE